MQGFSEPSPMGSKLHGSNPSHYRASVRRIALKNATKMTNWRTRLNVIEWWEWAYNESTKGYIHVNMVQINQHHIHNIIKILKIYYNTKVKI